MEGRVSQMDKDSCVTTTTVATIATSRFSRLASAAVAMLESASSLRRFVRRPLSQKRIGQDRIEPN